MPLREKLHDALSLPRPSRNHAVSYIGYYFTAFITHSNDVEHSATGGVE